MNLETPLKEVLRTTKDHLVALAGMGLHTVQDLILYLPRSHEDLTQMQTITSAPLEEKVTIRGIVDHIKLVYTRSKKQIVTAQFTDSEGEVAEAIWFNQPHIKRMIKDGDEVVMTGKLIENGYKLQFQSPSFEKGGERPLIHAGRLVPVYPQHDIINTKWLREKMILVKEAMDLLPETLPADLVKEEHLLSRSQAIRALHFPDHPEEVQKARDRIAFEQMFGIQREALERKKEWQGTTQDRLKTPMDVELIKALFASLKFTPTNSQKIAIYEILRDMEKDIPMSRLLEGDVGSGKTLVAMAVMANALRAGGQCALMVPTEVLARQHAATITRLLVNFHSYLQNKWKEESGEKRKEESGQKWKEEREKRKVNEHNFPLSTFHFPLLPSVGLLTGSIPKSEGDYIRRGLAAGTIDIAIGTHALIEDTVRFKDLRLVIVDEQHRFGVLQRQRLREKGSPHFLSMTATPIPRTLALTAFGDHDLSVLLEKPGKRPPIHTKVVAPKERVTVERFVDVEIAQGRQAFVICPLITESDELAEVKNVTAEAKRLEIEFPHRRVALLHGRLKPEEKQDIMRAFRARESDILVSTSVIEVGIDIPNATIIIIEGAERFGLSQLHQLRGRVGRSDLKSHCFLFTTTQSQAASPRLKAMEEHESGFMLAEIDLKLRGPGELYGLRQSGIPELQVGSLLNPELVVRARRAAEKMLGIKSGAIAT